MQRSISREPNFIYVDLAGWMGLLSRGTGGEQVRLRMDDTAWRAATDDAHLGGGALLVNDSAQRDEK